jgi:hypothetical protein
LRTAAATVDCYFTVSGALVAAYAAAVTAYAVHTAHYGVLVTYFVYARRRVLAQCADIVRRWCPNPPSALDSFLPPPTSPPDAGTLNPQENAK